jgi:hypothetical protein
MADREAEYWAAVDKYAQARMEAALSGRPAKERRELRAKALQEARATIRGRKR